MLDPSTVADLQALYRREFNSNLPDADAQALGNRLLELFDLLTEAPDASTTEPQPR